MGTAILRPRTAEVLAHLLSARGVTVGKNDLIDRVRAGARVIDVSLVPWISEARRALGEDGGF